MATKQWYNSSCLIILILLAGSLRAAAQARVQDFKYLDKLEGTWVMPTRSSHVVEIWRKTNDSTWQGKTWRVVGADSALQQSIQLTRSGNDIYFMPAYEGQKTVTPIRLRVRVLKPIGFVAEDLQQAFPRKITYRFKDARHLDARIEGSRDGTIEEYIFQYSLSGN
ncbi:hypothetical protein [Chitinophaga nivalis]|uniref:DUF4488 domain-containing protein n=1 Tax=Chitinophaga nivalis TaxID=2991709 RepID=A0ABT3IIQ1_9BACT|nr:hypothetical protein [Chitinophaga nivalis]MCW3466464.1 hypothetical protein [Chitinophaga nivalis]MCW3483845.1 hypothetical protein [Chitinophaga nivalis]